MPAMPQTRITASGPLLTSDGTLAQAGWATTPLLTYHRSMVRATRMRIKEWDYYLVSDDEYALALTISDLGYAALVSVGLIDLVRKTANTQSTMGIMPLGRVGLPSQSDSGLTAFQDNRTNMYFAVESGMRHLVVEFGDFQDGRPLRAEIVLDEEPRDSMVIATPWAEDPLAFYYNRKIVGMRAWGGYRRGALFHEFSRNDSFGLLDWGRGVWTYENTWYWAAAQGRQGGHVVGLNLGYGFGNTRAASENMVFVDGVAHKLGRVDFGIPVGEKGYAYLSPWHMTDDEGRLNLAFEPQIDRTDDIDLAGVIVSRQHQVFGTFSGTVLLDDGSALCVDGLRGSAEHIYNKY